MIKYTVILEKFGYETSKRVTVFAASPYEAMAVASKNGWQAVDVVAA